MPLAESNVKVNYLTLKALMQDTFVIRIIYVTLQSLCFGVEESKSTLSRLPNALSLSFECHGLFQQYKRLTCHAVAI